MFVVHLPSFWHITNNVHVTLRNVLVWGLSNMARLEQLSVFEPSPHCACICCVILTLHGSLIMCGKHIVNYIICFDDRAPQGPSLRKERGRFTDHTWHLGSDTISFLRETHGRLGKHTTAKKCMRRDRICFPNCLLPTLQKRMQRSNSGRLFIACASRRHNSHVSMDAKGKLFRSIPIRKQN